VLSGESKSVAPHGHSILDKDVPQLRCYPINPINDARWAEFVQTHPRSCIFHTVGWLEALRRTYGFEPIAFTTSPPGEELKNGLVFCRVKSWLTGNRLISLPFSDHCEPLFDSAEELTFAIRYLQADLGRQNCRYLELRPTWANLGKADAEAELFPAKNYFLHRLSLKPREGELFQGLDKDCVQRRIQRAERARLTEKCGNSDELLKYFYRLFVLTRARHRLPPIPYDWFQNLVRCLGDAVAIRLACQDETPVAAILTLRFRDVVYFKYGCSDTRFNRFGATPWLLWRAIAAAKSAGASHFDMGRTEESNRGLVAFKNRWVPRPTRLVYWRFPESLPLDSDESWRLRVAKRAFSRLPNRVLVIIGRLMYRHAA
jgi:hypothetical protein